MDYLITVHNQCGDDFLALGQEEMAGLAYLSAAQLSIVLNTSPLKYIDKAIKVYESMDSLLFNKLADYLRSNNENINVENPLDVEFNFFTTHKTGLLVAVNSSIDKHDFDVTRCILKPMIKNCPEGYIRDILIFRYTIACILDDVDYDIALSQSLADLVCSIKNKDKDLFVQLKIQWELSDHDRLLLCYVEATEF